MANEYDHTAGPARVLLGKDTTTRDPVFLPYAARDIGVALIGKAGTGKSSLLEHMILADLEHGTPGMVIDSHGLLAQRVMELATPEEADRIILLEALRNAPFGLNLLAVREALNENDDPVTWAADSVVATIKKLYGESDEFLPRLERYLDLGVRTLIPSQLTLLEVPRLFEDTAFRQECLARVTNPVDKERLQRKWAAYDRLRPVDQMTYTEALVNRLERVFASSIIAGIIGSRETTVPFDEILSGNKMLIVSLPSDTLSPERCDFIGAMLLCALADRIFVRNVSVAKPPRLHLYLDEYQRFATVTTAELLEQGRKYNAGITLAHQTLQQIREPRIRDSSRHAGTLIVLGVTRPDAEELAGEFPITPQEEWVETIEEIDGIEPVYVFSPTPAEDIYVKPHSDPEVADAVKRVFVGLRPQRGIFPYGMYAVYANELLFEGMNGRLTGKLLFDFYRHYSFFLNFFNDSPDYFPEVEDPVSGVVRPASRPPRPIVEYTKDGEHLREADKRNLNIPVDIVFSKEKRRWIETGLSPWFLVHCEHLAALRSGEYIQEFQDSDRQLRAQAGTRGWDELTFWIARVDRRDRKNPVAVPRRSIFDLRPYNGPSETDLERFDIAKTEEAIHCLRERLRLLLVIADGLQRQPVRVPSGEQQPRRTKRHIVHSGQTHADALNEVAGRLVHPPKRYVAHVRRDCSGPPCVS